MFAKHGLKGFESLHIWGRPEERTCLFAGRLTELQDTPGILYSPCLSPAHTFAAMGRALWPFAVLLDQLSTDEAAMSAFRSDMLALMAKSAESNAIPQRFITVHGIKA
jgi:hypothetical protein